MTTTDTGTTEDSTTAADRIRTHARTAWDWITRAWAHPHVVSVRTGLWGWLGKAWATPAALARTVCWTVTAVVIWRIGETTVAAVQDVAQSISALLDF